MKEKDWTNKKNNLISRRESQILEIGISSLRIVDVRTFTGIAVRTETKLWRSILFPTWRKKSWQEAFCTFRGWEFKNKDKSEMVYSKRKRIGTKVHQAKIATVLTMAQETATKLIRMAEWIFQVSIRAKEFWTSWVLTDSFVDGFERESLVSRILWIPGNTAKRGIIERRDQRESEIRIRSIRKAHSSKRASTPDTH